MSWAVYCAVGPLITPEIEQWKTVKGFDAYKVSNHGRVLSLSYNRTGKERLMRPGLRNGYPRVDLWANGVCRAASVHQLVAEAFLGPADGREINHKDGNRANAHISNLEYCTRSENMKHAFATGLQSNKGERHSGAKLSEADVLQIRDRLSSGEKQKAIAKDFNVDQSTVSMIATRKLWSHLERRV